MNNLKRKSTTPDSFSTVCPYLLVENLDKQLSFLKSVFQALTLNAESHDNGQLFHAEVAIGEVVIMMGLARPEWPARQSMNYIFVDNVQQVYDKALLTGGTSIMEPGDREYHLKEAGFSDLHGNQWWVAQPLKE